MKSNNHRSCSSIYYSRAHCVHICALCLVITVLCVSNSASQSVAGSNAQLSKVNDNSKEQSPATPPEIIYWASWKKNITVYDKNGMAWYCFTYRQSHCSPIRPPSWVANNKARSRKQKDGEGRNAVLINVTTPANLNNGNYYPLFPGKHPSSDESAWKDTTIQSGSESTTPTGFNYEGTPGNPWNQATGSLQSQNGVNVYPGNESPSTTPTPRGQPAPRGLFFRNITGRNRLNNVFYSNVRQNSTTGPTFWRVIKTVKRHRSTTPTTLLNTSPNPNQDSQISSGFNFNANGQGSLPTGVTSNPTAQGVFARRTSPSGNQYSTKSSNYGWSSYPGEQNWNPIDSKESNPDLVQGSTTYDPFEWNPVVSKDDPSLPNPTRGYATTTKPTTTYGQRESSKKGFEQPRGFDPVLYFNGQRRNNSPFPEGKSEDDQNSATILRGSTESRTPSYKENDKPIQEDIDFGSISEETPTQTVGPIRSKDDSRVIVISGVSDNKSSTEKTGIRGETTTPTDKNSEQFAFEGRNLGRNEFSTVSTVNSGQEFINGGSVTERNFNSKEKPEPPVLVSTNRETNTQDPRVQTDVSDDQTTSSNSASETTVSSVKSSTTKTTPFVPIFSRVTFNFKDDGISVEPTIQTPPTVANDQFKSPGFTIRGEPCFSACIFNQETKSFACPKKFSSDSPPQLNVGYCTPTPGIGHDGLPCKEKCRMTSDDRTWKCSQNQYCTPEDLIQKASEFFLPETTTFQQEGSTISNPEDERKYGSLELAPAYSSYGETCQDSCKIQFPDEEYTCTKFNTSEKRPCSQNWESTSLGSKCIGPCVKSDGDYFSCSTGKEENMGHCTPRILINKVRLFEQQRMWKTKGQNLYPKITPAPGYTVYGDVCRNICQRIPSQDFMTCQPVATEQRLPCSNSFGFTHKNQPCLGTCERNGNEYFSCKTEDDEEIGYCLPESYHGAIKEWTINNDPNVYTMKYDEEENLAPAYTVYGEPCTNTCKFRGINFASCSKQTASPTGEWSKIGYCTSEEGITHMGDPCEGDCIKGEFNFYWCLRVGNKFGYCTPKHLLEKVQQFENQVSANNEPRATNNDSFYSVNKNDVKDFETVLPAEAYTVYGEPCSDACLQLPNEEFTFCTKLDSDEKVQCSGSVGRTSGGIRCKGPCERNGKEYFSCPTNDDRIIGYCTPEFLIDRTFNWVISNQKKPASSDDRSGYPTTITVYPVNKQDEKDFVAVASAPAYTVYGQPCKDSCSKLPNEKLTFCTKQYSEERVQCSVTVGETSDGVVCKGPCERNGKPYFSCPTSNENMVGYCTPGFLIYKANKWIMDSGWKPDPSNGQLPSTTSIVTFYPINEEDQKDFKSVPSAEAYTVYGQPCQNTCSQFPNEQFTFCTRKDSGERVQCTAVVGQTSGGVPCTGPCERNGNEHFSCSTEKNNIVGYCTPGFLIYKANNWAYGNGWKPILTSENSGQPTTVTRYPDNPKDVLDFKDLPPAEAYTVYGQPCQDTCSQLQNEQFTSCTKQDLNERVQCTASVGRTSGGVICTGPCERNGTDYFSCPSSIDTLVGYCTPGFLIDKANSLANEYGLKPQSRDGESEPSTTVTYYPDNKEDVEVLKSIPPAPAYTVYGQPCRDTCLKEPNEQFLSCTVKDTNEKAQCTAAVGKTSGGIPCTGRCERNGNDFFSCPTKDENQIGYCTPGFLIFKANEHKFKNGFELTSNNDESGSSATVTFYPDNKEDVKAFESVPPARAYTVYGQPCIDPCSKRSNEQFLSCTVKDTNERAQCTTAVGKTSSGVPCTGRCKRDGKDYFSCPTNDDKIIGFCTPGFLILKANEFDEDIDSESSDGGSTSYTSVTVYPGKDDEINFESVPPAMAYSVYGQSCDDACSLLENEKFTTCKKRDSNERVQCTGSVGRTSGGIRCNGPCERNGNNYFSCPTDEDNIIGYCTPEFLIQKANESPTTFTLKPQSRDGESGPSTTVTYYPDNKEDVEALKSVPPAPAYTVYGQPCRDACSKEPNEQFLSCTVKDTNEKAQCTAAVGKTSGGVPCTGRCERNGNDLFSCPTKDENEIGYCTPGFLIFKANEWSITNGWKTFGERKNGSSVETVPLAQAYTAYGQPCRDACSKLPNEESTFCTNQNSGNRVQCTATPGKTSSGATCTGPCVRNGNEYFSCSNNDDEMIAYCTPDFLLDIAKKWELFPESRFMYADTRGRSNSSYPINYEEKEKYGNIRLAPSYTVYGEPCQSFCFKLSDPSSTSCITQNSTDLCSFSSDTTSDGRQCTGPCERGENEYFSCSTEDATLIGYCTPEFLLLKSKQWNDELQGSNSFTDLNTIALAPAYSVYGEPCQDSCLQGDMENSTYCTKQSTDEMRPCTVSSGITSDGLLCTGPCQRNGNAFFSCPTQDESKIGLCTPRVLISKTSQWRSSIPSEKTTSSPGSSDFLPLFSSISFYPINKAEASRYSDVPLAPSYSAYGHPCRDPCQTLDNEKSHFCSNVETRSREPCSISSSVTNTGQLCLSSCQKEDKDFFSCSVNQSNTTGYCTPNFLNLKSNEWKLINDSYSANSESTISSTGFYPVNTKDRKDFESVVSAGAYTVYGHPCKDACVKLSNEVYTTCTKQDSNDRVQCTSTVGRTSGGIRCTGPCERNGNEYFSCPTNDYSVIGYCTPGFLLYKANEWAYGTLWKHQASLLMFYPDNEADVEAFESVPRAEAYSVYGQPCRDACSKMPNEEFPSCTLQDPDERAQCTAAIGRSTAGVFCTGPCQKNGQDYFSCPTANNDIIGYCTPRFLIYKAKEWALDLTPTTSSGNPGSLIRYQINKEDEKDFESVPPARAYTAYGQPCSDACSKLLNEQFHSCTIQDSNERAECTAAVGKTSGGVPCTGRCERNGNDYFSCPKADDDSEIGYCTPGFLIYRASEWALGANDDPLSSLAYTVYGQPCKDACSRLPNEEYTFCTSRVSNRRRKCTGSIGRTTGGVSCIGPCERNGNEYFSCPTNDNNIIGYCTPDFLISKANSYRLINGPKEPKRISSNDPDAYLRAPLAPAYTVHGEPCSDACESRGFNYTWCTKQNPSQTGKFNLKGYCTKDEGITHTGEPCLEGCKKEGYPFHWCKKSNANFGFCTPKALIERSKLWSDRVTYTIYGEECGNKCAKYGYTYNWCKKKKPSSIGTWRDSDYCSPRTGYTSLDTKCVGECDKQGYDYYWCRDGGKTSGYCSPTLNTLQRNTKARAYTVFGEACSNECAAHGDYSYTWCTKVKSSNVGTWKWADYCTTDSKYTPYNEPCLDTCEKRGYDFYWCHKNSLWGYCTPEHLLQLLANRNSN